MDPGAYISTYQYDAGQSEGAERKDSPYREPSPQRSVKNEGGHSRKNQPGVLERDDSEGTRLIREGKEEFIQYGLARNPGKDSNLSEAITIYLTQNDPNTALSR